MLTLDNYVITSQIKEAKRFCEHLGINEVIIYLFIPFVLKDHHVLKAVFISIKRRAIVREQLQHKWMSPYDIFIFMKKNCILHEIET